MNPGKVFNTPPWLLENCQKTFDHDHIVKERMMLLGKYTNERFSAVKEKETVLQWI